jgi:hypothetical protein
MNFALMRFRYAMANARLQQVRETAGANEKRRSVLDQMLMI